MLLLKALIGGASILVLVNAGIALRGGYVSSGSCPRGGLFWFHPMLIPALVFAPIFPPRGWLDHYDGRFSSYAKKGSTILSGLWVWNAKPMFWLADAGAIKAVTSDRHTFTKDINSYSSVDIYGKSLVSTEGSEWRRHVVIAGAFSESNNALVWKETLRLVREWLSDELETSTVRSDDHGYGMRASWTAFSDPDLHGIPDVDDALPFHVALDRTLSNLFLQVLVPSFLYSFPVRISWLSDNLAVAKHAFASMKAYMTDIVASVRNEEKTDNDRNMTHRSVEDDAKEEESSADLLRRLVQANDAEDESGVRRKRTFTDNELFSNISKHLHTLSFAILLLALYPETQAQVRDESHRIWPSNDDLQMSSYRKVFEKIQEYISAFFHETLRCFPTEPRLIKLASNDAFLTGRRFKPAPATIVRKPDSSFDGAHTNVQFERDDSSEEQFSVIVPKGGVVMMNIWAVHMNPLVWGSDAHVFRPGRFIDTEDYNWPREGLVHAVVSVSASPFRKQFAFLRVSYAIMKYFRRSTRRVLVHTKN